LKDNKFNIPVYADSELGPGRYTVFIVALGKPGGKSDLRGWIYNGL
jgi:hypothetical protein